jgi:hypothetical protein
MVDKPTLKPSQNKPAATPQPPLYNSNNDQIIKDSGSSFSTKSQHSYQPQNDHSDTKHPEKDSEKHKFNKEK